MRNEATDKPANNHGLGALLWPDINEEGTLTPSDRVASVAMDLHYDHQTIIYVLNACHDEDAADLIALGGDHSVEIIAVTDAACISIASFHVGMRITAVAWSPKTISPSNSDNWVIE